MGDRVWWNYDCPDCGEKDGVECYEQLTSNLKTESCKSCGYTVPYSVTDDDNIIEVEKGEPYVRKPAPQKQKQGEK